MGGTGEGVETIEPTGWGGGRVGIGPAGRCVCDRGEERPEGGHGRAVGSKGIGRERGESVFVWVIACWTSVCVWGYIGPEGREGE